MFGAKGLQVRDGEVVLELSIHQPVIVDAVAPNSKCERAGGGLQADRDRFVAGLDSQIFLVAARKDERPEAERAKNLTVSLLVQPLRQDRADMRSAAR